MFIIYSTVENNFYKMESTNTINGDVNYCFMLMVFFKYILKYLRANLQEQYQRSLYECVIYCHCLVFASFTTETDAKKTEAGYGAKKTEQDKEEEKEEKTKQNKKQAKKEQKTEYDVSVSQEALDWAIEKRIKAYKTLIEYRELVLKSISAIDIYIFMSTIRIHINEQDCADDVKNDFIKFLECVIFTTEQRTFLKIN